MNTAQPWLILGSDNKKTVGETSNVSFMAEHEKINNIHGVEK